MSGRGHPGRVYRDCVSRGVRTRVLDAGPPDAPAVLLLHGFLSSHLEFDDVIDTLAVRFRVIAPDLPGFGESARPSPARYSYELGAFTESVLDLMAALGVGRASVVGHELGGAVALSLAVHHPELAPRLLLVSPLVYPFPRPRKLRFAMAPVVGPLVFKQLLGRALFRAYFREDVFSPLADVPWERVDRHYELFNTPPSRESAYAVLSTMLDTRPVVALLSRITRPALVVWGRDDAIFPPHHAQRLTRQLPNARLTILEGGHSPHEEGPSAFAALATEFFEGKRT
jgi:pimeloyl-ACP methyl ester carboxylesterase